MIVYMSQSVYEIDFTDQLNLLDTASFIYKVSQSLAQKKRACWIAGGAVRDLWLARKPKDIDLVTDALDEEILELFPKAVLVGQKFGVYKLPFNFEDRNIIIDLTVFREEDEYVDGRRPQSIKRSTPLEDSKRRDFTINALFYDLENHEVVDYVGGVQDIQNKVLKCVGDADRRFNEDHLRLLRLARFKAQLGFEIPQHDLDAAMNLSHLIKTVSGERVYEEVFKVIQSQNEIEFWSQELTQKLWHSLGAEVYQAKINHIIYIQRSGLSAEEQLVANIMTLWNYAPEAVEFLKTRLKCSKDDAVFAKKLAEYAYVIRTNISALDVALEVDSERNRNSIIKALDYMALAGECPHLSMTDVKAFLYMYSTPLITGGDLVGKCEPSKTQALLQAVRRAQFEKKIRTSVEALIFLKNQKLII